MDKTIWPIEKLSLWDKNPRSIKEGDFLRLKKQIEDLGQYKPLLVTEDGTVIGGNMRLRAYQDLGIQEVWVSVVTPKDENEKLAYALSDNDRAGFYDEDLLANLVVDYPDFKWEDFAVDLREPQNLQELLDRFAATEEDEVPEVAIGTPVSRKDEIYQLGRHRIMCGDATNLVDVARLMGMNKADLVFTDPPYNVDYVGKTQDALKIQNDKFQTTQQFYQFLLDAFTNMNAASKEGAAIYVCHADSEGLTFRQAFIDAGYNLRQCIIWNKNSMVMGRQDYHWKHEPILYGWKEGAAHNWYGDRTQVTVWDIDRPSRSEAHPTMKPVALVARAIQNNSKGEDIVLDIFAGSGSTIMACEQTNRIGYGLELDPAYVDVIRKRYWIQKSGHEEGWAENTPAMFIEHGKN